jgi:2-polyprenyl-3-methyl-5-hydroxy-6-metoxy-1,4-benzoquinol methylase
MRTRPAPDCRACGAPGKTLYADLRDRLFGAPGSWRMARCPTPECGMLWLDPTPLPEDLGLAYAAYYTHEPAAAGRSAAERTLRSWAKQGYFSERFGYRVRAAWFKRLLARLGARSPELREYLDRMVLAQPPRADGRALDVGCGEGRTVETMAALGWDAEGVDFDAAAIARAAARGLRVRVGTVEAQGYPAAHFDAIGVSHVLEHLPDPLATLAECCRLLRPGGQLVVLTPNALCLGHRRFGRDWRGLEPPRHLQVFTPGALRATAERAGLRVLSMTAPTIGAAFMHAESRRIRGEAGAHPGDGPARAFAREAIAAAAVDPWAGEELLMFATAG